MKEKFNELLKQLQAENLLDHGYWQEDIPEVIWDNHFEENNYEEIAKGLDVDKRRWYQKSTSVIKIYGRFLGIRIVDEVYSESMGVADIESNLEFFEMKEVPSVTYEKI